MKRLKLNWNTLGVCKHQSRKLKKKSLAHGHDLPVPSTDTVETNTEEKRRRKRVGIDKTIADEREVGHLNGDTEDIEREAGALKKDATSLIVSEQIAVKAKDVTDAEARLMRGGDD